MLKEILIDSNPLLLSSLGAFVYENRKEIILQKLEMHFAFPFFYVKYIVLFTFWENYGIIS